MPYNIVVDSFHAKKLCMQTFFKRIAILDGNGRFAFLPHCMECRRGLEMRILSVRLSVFLSVTRVDCDKTVERNVQNFIPYERS